MSEEIKVVCSDGVELVVPDNIIKHSDFFKEVCKNKDSEFWGEEIPGEFELSEPKANSKAVLDS